MDLMQLFDMILHVDKMLDAVIKQYGTLVYFVLFAIIFCETAFVIFRFCLEILYCSSLAPLVLQVR